MLEKFLNLHTHFDHDAFADNELKKKIACYLLLICNAHNIIHSVEIAEIYSHTFLAKMS